MSIPKTVLSRNRLTNESNVRVTLTTRPDYHKVPPRDQLIMLVAKIQQIFKGCQYNFHPELTKKKNVHFHGTVWGEKILVDMSLEGWKTEVGFIKVSKKTYGEWHQYVTKDCFNIADKLSLKMSCVHSGVKFDEGFPTHETQFVEELEEGIVEI